VSIISSYFFYNVLNFYVVLRFCGPFSNLLVHCTVRTRGTVSHVCYYAIQRLGRSVTSLSSPRPGFDLRSVRVRFVVNKVALGHIFLLSASLFPCQYHSTIVPYSSSSTCCSYQKDKERNLGLFQKAMLFRKSGSVGRKSVFIFYAIGSKSDFV
jgi:hypothetical protein